MITDFQTRHREGDVLAGDTQVMGVGARTPPPPRVWSPWPWVQILASPSEVRCFPPVSPRSGDTHRPYFSGVVGVLWTELHGEASKKPTWPTRAPKTVGAAGPVLRASETGLAECPPGDSCPLHRLGRKQEPKRTVCFTTCGWSRPVLFPKGQGWSDLAFGCGRPPPGRRCAPDVRMEVRSPHCGPLRAPGLRRVAWLPAIWPLRCVHLFGLEGWRPSPESHTGRAVNGPLLLP